MAGGGQSLRNAIRLENLLRMGVAWTLAVIFSYTQLLYQKLGRSAISFPRSPKLTPGLRQPRLVCIVTGASSGIGKATAETLAVHGYHVILAGRSKSELLEVTEFLKAKHENVSLEALELDVCSVSSIISFKDAVEKSLHTSQGSKVLQLLINNAGILAGHQRHTEAGFDSMMATNYLGPHLLTQQLLPLFHKGSPQARVVNVTSFTHRCAKVRDVDAKQLAQGTLTRNSSTRTWYSIAQIYENSKFCLLMFTYELHRRMITSSDSANISVLAADPGIVQTNIMRELPHILVAFAYFVLSVLRLLQSPSDGSMAVIDAALAPEGLSGKYFFGGNGRTIRSSALSYDTDLSKQIWEASTSLCERALATEISVNGGQ